MLKADLHIHTNSDPFDRFIRHSEKDVIDRAAELGFDVISITNHCRVSYSEELRGYAEKKGILLIAGAELVIEGREVLVYNISAEEASDIKLFKDLYEIRKRRKDIFVIAPHPYFVMGKCLGDLIYKHEKLFDAIEYSYFYTSWLNLNRKAAAAAKKMGKPMVSLSDIHYLKGLGRSFIEVDSKKDIISFFSEIKKGNVRTNTKPLSFYGFVLVLIDSLIPLSIRNWF